MQQAKIIQILQNSPKKIFTTHDLQVILKIDQAASTRVLAGRLVKNHIIKRLTRGCYFLTTTNLSDFEIANALYRPSYISLASALSYYGILIQTPPEITSLTTRRAKNITRAGRTFSFNHINPKYFVDYQNIQGFLMATPEKALLDSMFLAALGQSSLPLDELQYSLINKKKLARLAAGIKNQAFQKYYQENKKYL